MKNFDEIIEKLQKTAAESMLKSAITEQQWDAADEKYGVFFNTDSREIEIWTNIQDSGWARVAEQQNAVQFLGFIDVDTAITSEFEVIIDTLKYKKQQQEEYQD